MFHSGHWAAALINSIERDGGDIEDGLEFFKVLASWVKKLPGEVSGSSAAQKLEKLVREGLAKSGVASPAPEAAIRFFVLMAKKNKIRHVDSVLEEAKKLLDKKRGVVAVSIEYAFPIDGSDAGLAAAKTADESRIKEEIKKRTAAARVDLTERFNADLIGGYRLRIGDEIMDASVRLQLRKLSDHICGQTI